MSGLSMSAPMAVSQSMTTATPTTAVTPTSAAVGTQLFGVVIPGRPVRTDFVPVDASGLKWTLNMTCPGDLQSPLALVREIVFFLLPGVALPENHGVLCYYQLTAVPQPHMGPQPPPSSTGFELLGAITPETPSSVLQTGWAEKEEVLQVSQNEIPLTVTIAVSIETMDNLQNLGVAPSPATNNPTAVTDQSSKRNSNRLYVAQQIAYDLFNFMQSFDTGAAGSGNMVVPNNIFDRWFKRFENRFQRDPNFFLKKKANE